MQGLKIARSAAHLWPLWDRWWRGTPDLMLGLAGIGYFYLRLHDPTIPSILLVESENFW